MKQIITSLDLGSNSIKVLVGEIYNDELFVLACSEVKSNGIKKGIIVDEEQALSSIKEALKRTEDVIGIKLDKIVLLVPSNDVMFTKSEGYIDIKRESKTINGSDITKVLEDSIYNKIESKRELVSVEATEFLVGDSEITKNPKGKIADKLAVNSIISTIPKENIYSVIKILETLGIKVAQIALGGMADYYEFRKPEYKNLVGAVINIGANKTEISVINEDILVGSLVLDVGGRNVDRDISYIYDLKIEDSKKIKEHFAFAHKNDASTSEIIECLTKNDEHIKINQYEVSEIVYSRIKEILELSKKQINLLTKSDLSYIIMVGGTTEIEGFQEVFREVFGKTKDVTRVEDIGVRNNRFSSALGIIKYYNEKLKFRDKLASTIEEESQEELFVSKKKIDGNSLLGKVYSYFFDN